MRSLNMFKYFRHNPSKVIPQVLSISLGIFLMYFACILGGGTMEGMMNELLLPYEKMTIVFPESSSMNNENTTFENLKNSDNVKDVIQTGISFASVNVLIKNAGTDAFSMKSADIRKAMDYMGNRFLKGKWPQKEYEALVNEKMVNSLKIKIGDWIGDGIDDKYHIHGKYLVTGIYRGKSSFIFSCTGKTMISDNVFLAIAKPGKLSVMNREIGKMTGIYDYVSLDMSKKAMNMMFGLLKLFGCLILLIIMLVVTMTVSNINYIIFYDRCPEFALLQCIGQSRKAINGRLFMEMASISVCGFIIGTGMSIISGWLFNVLYAVPRGTPVSIINPWYFLLVILIPLCVQFFSLSPVKRYMRRNDFIEVLEGKA